MKERFGKFSKIAGFVTGMAMSNVAAAQPEAVSQETSHEVAEASDQETEHVERLSFTNTQAYVEQMRSDIDRYINQEARYIYDLRRGEDILALKYQGSGFVEFRLNEQGQAIPTRIDGTIDNTSDGGRQLLNFLRTNVGISNLYLVQNNVNVDEVMGQRHLSSDYYGLQIFEIPQDAPTLTEGYTVGEQNIANGAGFSEEEALINALRNLISMGSAYYAELPHEISSATLADGDRNGAYRISRSGLEMALLDVKIERVEPDSQGIVGTFMVWVSARNGQVDLNFNDTLTRLSTLNGFDAADYQRRQVLRSQLVDHTTNRGIEDLEVAIGSTSDIGIDLINDRRAESRMPLTQLTPATEQRINASISRAVRVREALAANGADAYSGPRSGAAVSGRAMNVRLGTDTTESTAYQLARRDSPQDSEASEAADTTDGTED